MNEQSLDSLDRRLARALATLDASAGFEARLARKIAGSAPAREAAVHARAQAERDHRAELAALRRGLRTDLVLVAGAALAAAGPAWLGAPLLARLVGALPGVALAGCSAVLFIAWLGVRFARGAELAPLRA